MCAKVKISVVHHSLTMLCITMLREVFTYDLSHASRVVRHIGKEGGSDISNLNPKGGAERGHTFVV